MKKLLYLLPLLAILSACNDEPLDEEMTRGWNPISCTQKSSEEFKFSHESSLMVNRNDMPLISPR